MVARRGAVSLVTRRSCRAGSRFVNQDQLKTGQLKKVPKGANEGRDSAVKELFPRHERARRRARDRPGTTRDDPGLVTETGSGDWLPGLTSRQAINGTSPFPPCGSTGHVPVDPFFGASETARVTRRDERYSAKARRAAAVRLVLRSLFMSGEVRGLNRWISFHAGEGSEYTSEYASDYAEGGRRRAERRTRSRAAVARPVLTASAGMVLFGAALRAGDRCSSRRTERARHTR